MCNIGNVWVVHSVPGDCCKFVSSLDCDFRPIGYEVSEDRASYKVTGLTFKTWWFYHFRPLIVDKPRVGTSFVENCDHIKRSNRVLHLDDALVALDDGVSNGDSTINHLVRVLEAAGQRFVVLACASFPVVRFTVTLVQISSFVDINNLEPLLHDVVLIQLCLLSCEF